MTFLKIRTCPVSVPPPSFPNAPIATTEPSEEILIEQPDWVINCGAYTSVEGSEINFELAKRHNFQTYESNLIDNLNKVEYKKSLIGRLLY